MNKTQLTEPLIDSVTTEVGENETAGSGHKDNRCKAIIAINIFGISFTAMGALYKIIAREGFNVVDFTFFRCVSALLVSGLWNVMIGVNPLKKFPWSFKGTLALRSVLGHATFTMFNLAVPYAPLSLIMVIW